MNVNTKHARRIPFIGLFLCGADCGTGFSIKVSPSNPRILADQNNTPFMIVAGNLNWIIVNRAGQTFGPGDDR
jgi:hypothetical protein